MGLETYDYVFYGILSKLQSRICYSGFNNAQLNLWSEWWFQPYLNIL